MRIQTFRIYDRPLALKSASLGFTLVEMLVSIGIVGVLLAMLLPAVQSVRESSRKVTCSNRLHQMGLAFHSFDATHRLLPSNGGETEGNFIQAVDGASVKPMTTGFVPRVVYTWGVGAQSFPPYRQPGSWCYSLLPFLKLKAIADAEAYEERLNIFLCPSRSRMAPAPPQRDRYGEYESGGHAMAKTDFAANHQLIRDLPQIVSLGDVRDGSSQTILVGEKTFDHAVHLPTSWWWDEPLWVGGSKGTARDGDKIVPDDFQIDYKHNWGSAHDAGAHFLFVDGHVEYLSDSVSRSLLRSLITPDWGDSGDGRRSPETD